MEKISVGEEFKKSNPSIDFSEYKSNPENFKIKKLIADNTTATCMALFTLNGITQLVYLEDNDDPTENVIVFYDLTNGVIKEKRRIESENRIGQVKYYENKGTHYLLIINLQLTINLYDITNDFKEILEIKGNLGFQYCPLAMLFEDNSFKIIGTKLLPDLPLFEYLLSDRKNQKLASVLYDSTGKSLRLEVIEQKSIFTCETYYIGGEIFILYGGIGGLTIYNHSKNKWHNSYSEIPDPEDHYDSKIGIINEKVVVMDISSDGKLRIWDFYLAEVITVFDFNQLFPVKDSEFEANTLRYLCPWNENIIITGGSDGYLYFVDIFKGTFKKVVFEDFDEIYKIIKFKNGMKEYFIISEFTGKTILLGE